MEDCSKVILPMGAGGSGVVAAISSGGGVKPERREITLLKRNLRLRTGHGVGKMYFLQKLKVKDKQTANKAVDPLDVRKNRVPNSVAIRYVQDAVVSTPVQGGVQNKIP